MILMYHHVAPPEKTPADHGKDGWYLTLSPETLRRHIQLLRERGFHFVSLDEMVSHIASQGRAPAGSVAVTLDDGWVDNYEYAFPVFSELRAPATLFVTTGHLRSGSFDARKMTLEQMREVTRHGVSIGGHSRSHPTLARLPLDQAREEIRGCKQDLEDGLGIEVPHFAYPGGNFNRAVAEVTREAGYRSACSVVGLGVNTRSTMFWLHRDVLTDAMDTFPDRCRLSHLARLLLTPRARSRIRAQLDD